MTTSFQALVIDQVDGKPVPQLKQLTQADLPVGEVLVAIDYSSINYKDAMALTGTGKIIRSFPMVPGIDFAGTVVESSSVDYKAGDKVVLTDLTSWTTGTNVVANGETYVVYNHNTSAQQLLIDQGILVSAVL